MIHFTWYNRRQDEGKSYKRTETATNAKWCNQQVLWRAKERGWRQKLVEEKGVINLPSKAENRRERGGVGKWRVLEHKSSELKRVKLEQKLLWRAYRNSLMFFRMVPSLSPYDLLFQDWGFANAPCPRPLRQCIPLFPMSGHSTFENVPPPLVLCRYSSGFTAWWCGVNESVVVRKCEFSLSIAISYVRSSPLALHIEIYTVSRGFPATARLLYYIMKVSLSMLYLFWKEHYLVCVYMYMNICTKVSLVNIIAWNSYRLHAYSHFAPSLGPLSPAPRLGLNGPSDIFTPSPIHRGTGYCFRRFLFVYIFLCFFVSKITRKRLDRFAWNFQGRWGVTMGWPDYIFGQFWETARCRDAQHGDGVCCAFAPQLV